MKRFAKCLTLVAFLAMLCTVVLSAAFGGAVYDRTVMAVAATSGSTFTNSMPYSALALKRVWIEYSATASDTVTLTRVTAGGVYTQAVGTITVSTSIGNTATFTAAYLKNGDKLVFVSGAGSASTAIIEYEVQQH
jgi:hypothetical protein